jgi:hypothetical protein
MRIYFQYWFSLFNSLSYNWYYFEDDDMANLFLLLQIAVLTEPGGCTASCRALFIACEHYWHPLLPFRMIVNRFRSVAPVILGPLPTLHAHIFVVVRMWLETCDGLFATVPELGNSLRTFCTALLGMGGAYRHAADEFLQLSVAPTPSYGGLYRVDFASVPHQHLYEVGVR